MLGRMGSGWVLGSMCPSHHTQYPRVEVTGPKAGVHSRSKGL